MIKLDLPFPPSANRYWRNYRGRMVKSTEATTYIAEARCMALQQTDSAPYAEPVELRASIFFPSMKGDLDNRIKVLIDALNGIAYDDDKRIFEIHVVRKLSRGNPGVAVEVEPKDI